MRNCWREEPLALFSCTLASVSASIALMWSSSLLRCARALTCITLDVLLACALGVPSGRWLLLASHLGRLGELAELMELLLESIKSSLELLPLTSVPLSFGLLAGCGLLLALTQRRLEKRDETNSRVESVTRKQHPY